MMTGISILHLSERTNSFDDPMLLEFVIDKARPYWFRGKGRLLNALVSAQGHRTANVYGCLMSLDLGDLIQRNIYLGTYEPAESSFVKGWLRPGMRFVDVGANVGYYTALGAACVGGNGHVFSIEPSPFAYASLENMVRLNEMRHVSVFPFGCGASTGERNLYIPPKEAGNHSPSMLGSREGEPVPVSVRTLDECFSEWGLDHADLVKIDIEGYEYEAFRGAQSVLREGRILAVLCEFNDYWLRRAGASPAALYDLLIESGFESVCGNPSFPTGCVITLPFVLKRRS